MQKIKLLAFVILCLISLSSLASNVGVDHANSSSCNIDNSHNIGNYIKNYVMCGVSFLHPKDTLFGALSLILNVVCLTISLWLIVVNSTKYVTFTMRYGVPGGEKMQGGMMIVRSGLLVTFLTPCISNGFSPAQDLMRSLTELGIYIADSASNRVIDYVSSEGAMIQHDPTNVDEVTTQIIASEMCRKLFILHHEQDVVNGSLSEADAQSAVKVVLKSSVIGGFSVSWDYFDPYRMKQNGPMSNFSDQRNTTKENDSVGAACGSINLTIPTALKDSFFDKTHIHFDQSSDSFTFSGIKPYQQPYADLINSQYGALKKHIQNIREILKDIDVDLVEITKASALSSQIVDESALDSIEKSQVKEAHLANSVTSNAVKTVALLVDANNKYRDSIVSIGSNAAQSVNLTNNITTPDCDQPSPSSIVSPCVQGQSWESQLKEQGFAALGTYYFVYLVTNQKIASLQAHLFTPDNEIKAYSEKYSKTHDNATTFAATNSDSGKSLMRRSDSLVAAYQRSVESTNLNISFSAVENLGNTAEDNDHWYSSITKFLFVWADTAKFIAQMIKGDGNGDLILHLVNVGNLLSNLATGLAAVAGGLMLASNFGVGAATKVASKFQGAGDGGSSLGSMVMWVILLLFSASILFQYVIPAIPMFKWLLELQSWAIMMFMSLFYAPLWIMAHASITDDRFMAEQTMTGYGLAFELITRPLLMVGSFWGMILLLHIADIGFVMMLSYLIGMGTYGTLGILSIIAITVISLFVAYQLAMRTFDILAEFPDAIISRLNFGARPLGDTTRDGTMSKMVIIPQRTLSSSLNTVIKSGAQTMGLISKETK